MNTVMFGHGLRDCCFTGAVVVTLSACTSLLPDARQEKPTPWQSYAEAQAIFAGIIPGKTRISELKTLGIDPEQMPNIALLGHVDLLRRLAATSSFDIGLLDPALQVCVSGRQACFGYAIEQNNLQRKRSGNFWLDFLNFERTVDVSGWRFDAILVISNDTVIYKLWSGTPNIRQVEQERSPLGPFQGFGPALLTR